MPYDEQKVEEAVLALLYLWSSREREHTFSWKTFDWGVTERLFEQGLIYDPRNKNKSVVFTEEGLAKAEALCEKLFNVRAEPKRARSKSPSGRKGVRPK